MNHTDDPADARRAMMYIADRMNDPRVEALFTVNRHKLSAARALLDLLDVPPPDWARRNLSGAAARHKAMVDRCKADRHG